MHVAVVGAGAFGGWTLSILLRKNRRAAKRFSWVMRGGFSVPKNIIREGKPARLQTITDGATDLPAIFVPTR